MSITVARFLDVAGGLQPKQFSVGSHDKIWTKYTGSEPPYGLRDPSINERRVLFICGVDRIATFGKP
jgi:hypothetical protein